MYDTYRGDGLQIIGFPCNQFGAQEPEDEEGIMKFVGGLTPKVTFPIMKKIDVKGDNADPLYTYLQNETKSEITWNFAKFLVDKDGLPLKFYHHDVCPVDIIPDLKPLLNQQ